MGQWLSTGAYRRYLPQFGNRMSLNLTPNEIVGYRIKPDWHSYNVVLVKRHGDASKNAGKEYETTLAYCKHPESAAQWIFSHALRVKAEASQADILAIEGSCADIRGMLDVVAAAKAEVSKAVAELQSRIDALGMSRRELVQAMGAVDESEPV